LEIGASICPATQVSCDLSWRVFGSSAQRHAVAHGSHSAIAVGASFAVINAVAVADIEAVLIAISPNRVLNEPGKGLRKSRVELSSIDPVGHGLNDLCAATGPEKVVNRVSMAIMLPPTSIQRLILFGAPSRMEDKAIVRTLSETP